MNLYMIHGILQVIAFIILYPIGALIAIFRDRIGFHWKPIHIFLQLFASLLVFVAISIAYLAEQKYKKQESERKEKPLLNKIHTTLGPIVVSLVILQLLWAFFGRKIMTNWILWYYIHITISSLIIVGGFTNVMIAWKMIKN